MHVIICFPLQHKYLRVLDLSENSIRVVTNLQNNCVGLSPIQSFSNVYCICLHIPRTFVS